MRFGTSIFHKRSLYSSPFCPHKALRPRCFLPHHTKPRPTCLTFSFAGITGANDNASFGFQLLTGFAPGTGVYAATGAGTIRYDNVPLSGMPIADAVPEPATYALLLVGLGWSA